MTRRTLLAVFAAAPVAAMFGVGCGGCNGKGTTGGVWQDKPGPKVVVTFAPLYSFTKAVLGGHGEIKTILLTTGPHDYHEDFKDAEAIDGADLFFQNGLDLEGSLVSTIRKARPSPKAKFVDLGSRLDEKTLLEGADDHDHGPGGHSHGHGVDPHVWLGIDHAKRMVEIIRDEVKVDAAHAADYDRNTAAYLAELDKLKEDGKKMLADVPKEKRKFVTMHDSLAYFAKTFDLTIAGVIEFVPGQEPSPKELNEMIEACTKHDVRVIALEPQFSTQGGAKTLEKELKAKGVRPVMIEIDPLETASAEMLSADLYVKTMRENLKVLAEALTSK